MNVNNGDELKTYTYNGITIEYYNLEQVVNTVENDYRFHPRNVPFTKDMMFCLCVIGTGRVAAKALLNRMPGDKRTSYEVHFYKLAALMSGGYKGELFSHKFDNIDDAYEFKKSLEDSPYYKCLQRHHKEILVIEGEV